MTTPSPDTQEPLTDEKAFPIHSGSIRALPDLPHSLPWGFVAQFERQAQRNHGQTLERLADRGGLDWTELFWASHGHPWDGPRHKEQRHDANAVLKLLERWRALKSGGRDDG